jgi:hypothetical protein
MAPAATANAADRAIVEIITVPAMPGARFTFDGDIHKADAQGIIRVPTAKNSDGHRMSILDTEIEDGDHKFTFVRWWAPGHHEQDFRKDLTRLEVRTNLRVKAAFRATYRVKYSFVDQAAEPVRRSRVDRIELRGDHGQTLVGNGSGELQMVGIRPVVDSNTLVSKNVRYSVQRVDVDGSNVVQASQLVFQPSQQPSVVVPLLLRSAHFSTRDFLFGWPVGKAVTLTYPDGGKSTVPLDANGKASVFNLARGNYSVRVEAQGYSFDRPIVLSRNQYVDLPVITYLDFVVLGTVIAACFGGLYALRVVRHRSHVEAPKRSR